MIPTECKRLAEVDFPIAVVSKHAAREKSIRHGHPSTLHLWWARRPLASSRAVLLALLLPDPCDEYCPEDFKVKARGLLPQVQGDPGLKDAALRQALLKFIGDFANWDLSANETYLKVARGLVKAAHPEETPLVVDPFAGGGSIPLEALRLGCDAFASDLNPVACLILKVMLEDIPRHGPALAEELRKAGAEIKKQAEKDLVAFYPPDSDGARPIAYLWARTVRCEAPDCGAEIPLMRSFWLSKKAIRRRALKPRAVRPRGGTLHVEFEMFEPKTEDDVPKGTVTRAKATCPCCARTLAPDRVRAQLTAQRGGADVQFDATGRRTGGARLLAVVTLKVGEIGRQYRLAKERDYDAVWKARNQLNKVTAKRLVNGLSSVPDEPTPAGGGSGAGRAFSVKKYGMLEWGDLFTARQKLGLITFVRACTGAKLGFEAVGRLSGAVFDRLVDKYASLVHWHDSREFADHVFARQALSLKWTWAEIDPLLDVGWDGAVEWVALVCAATPSMSIGQSQVADAVASPLPDRACQLWFTDPPYYDAIPYSDLSDFFFVWLKRMLPSQDIVGHLDPLSRLTPKDGEVVQDETKSVAGGAKDRAFFEDKMAQAFAEGRRVLQDDGVGSVVFAHKTTEGWEALLSGMIAGGWTITGSWPIATEMSTRLRARESAALATSVHLICRPRTEDKVGDWGECLRELPRRVTEWMQRLQKEHVRGADLVFACIGPALEIFSRYAKVETAEGREVQLAEYLEKVWEVVGRAALEQVLGGGTGALEEDARLTALFLWTLQSSNGGSLTPGPSPGGRGEIGGTGGRGRNGGEEESGEDEEDADDEDEAPKKKKAGGYSLIFDVARRFAQPLGIHLPEWEGRIIETEKGVVRLLAVSERAKQLFGEEGAHAAAAAFERNAVAASQMVLFPEEETVAPRVKGRNKRSLTPGPSPGGRGENSGAGGRGEHGSAEERGESMARREATTLDRVHAAMLLQRSGQTNALRALLNAEQERGPDFLRLANALSALYPRESEEKRLLDAMLLAVPR
ncbi:MAG: DUF1156 domain-containing protein [Betaproteobacteria bacterium]|nr:DUF1156 domain-containing protein [Betaproteobacteria bacterium]